MVPALIILALWVALLAPGVVKWLRNHARATSIASFHRQLQQLERTGPKLFEPAHRLGGQDEPTADREHDVPPRPRLALVPTGATEKGTTMRYDDRHEARSGRHADPFGQVADDAYQPGEAWDDPWGEPDPVPTRAHQVRGTRYDAYHDVEHDDPEPRDALTPSAARVRRMRILLGLGSAIVGSLLLGIVTGVGILYALTLVSVVAMLAYLVLMYYASSVGMYGNDALARITPVARSVIAADEPRSYRFDDEEDDWGTRRVAAAR